MFWLFSCSIGSRNWPRPGVKITFLIIFKRDSKPSSLEAKGVSGQRGPSSISLSFVCFSINVLKIETVHFSGIRNQIVAVEGKCTDHWTTATALVRVYLRRNLIRSFKSVWLDVLIYLVLCHHYWSADAKVITIPKLLLKCDTFSLSTLKPPDWHEKELDQAFTSRASIGDDL